MAEPFFNGQDIFGAAPVSRRVEPANARQINAYPGIMGVESIELGSRLAYTDFQGIWYADGADDTALGDFIAQVTILKRAAVIGTLIDTHGITSTDAILETFELLEETKYAPGFGWCAPYAMRFIHLNFANPSGG